MAAALQIESRAKIRLADEFDSAQDRNEVQRHGGDRSKIAGQNLAPASPVDLGLTARKSMTRASCGMWSRKIRGSSRAPWSGWRGRNPPSKTSSRAISPAQARLPKTYEAAKQALAACTALDECKEWADKAAALASYARQAEDKTLQNMALKIRALATRRAGELLKEIQPGSGSHRKSIADDTFTQTRTEAAREAGLSKRQKDTATRIANIPEEEFDAQVEGESPPTLSDLASQGIKPRPKPPIDLGGRNPSAFNRALHFLALFENHARAVEREDIDTAWPA